MVLSPCLEDFVVVNVFMFLALAVVFSLAGLLAQRCVATAAVQRSQRTFCFVIS